MDEEIAELLQDLESPSERTEIGAGLGTSNIELEKSLQTGHYYPTALEAAIAQYSTETLLEKCMQMNRYETKVMLAIYAGHSSQFHSEFRGLLKKIRESEAEQSILHSL